jgi:DNA-directed RNA polymerase subunit M/transcription elongation factor TFIIS
MNNATVGKHPCPECGGDLVWNAGKQSLACPYCGTMVPWKNAENVLPGDIQENDLVIALKEHPQDQRGWGEQRREVKCESCQAISVFVDGKVAQRCDFCGSPSIIAHESERDAITPQYVLPFKISDGQVRDAIRKWYGTHWFAPNKLKRMALTDTLHGIYLPYWTFDAHVDADWTAEAGHYYYTSQSYTDSQGRSQTRQVRHTRWESASGNIKHFFDDELIPGTAGVHEKLLREVEPFPTITDLKAYSPEFVRGWTVERYQIDLSKAADLNREQMQQKTTALCASKVPGDTYRNLNVNANYQSRSFKHVLVPIWLVSYTYGSKNFQVLANGYTGKLAGEYPKSWIKIAFVVLAGMIALLIFAALADH